MNEEDFTLELKTYINNIIQLAQENQDIVKKYNLGLIIGCSGVDIIHPGNLVVGTTISLSSTLKDLLCSGVWGRSRVAIDEAIKAYNNQD